MNILVLPLRITYSLSRRFGIIDVVWLLSMSLDESRDNLEPQARPRGYEIRVVSTSELAELRRSGLVNAQVGDAPEHAKNNRVLIGAFVDSRLVSFAWIAQQAVAGKDNYSRSPHLGTSIGLSEGSAFVYNAWTDPDHRGNRLMASLLEWAVRNQITSSQSLLTTIDWSNDRSCRAFEHLGMHKLGLIVRIGRGRMQLSLVPSSAKSFGLRLADDAPGFKIAW